MTPPTAQEPARRTSCESRAPREPLGRQGDKDSVQEVLTAASGNRQPIGGIKVITERGGFVVRAHTSAEWPRHRPEAILSSVKPQAQHRMLPGDGTHPTHERSAA